MRRDEGKLIIENVKRRGYVLINCVYYPPNSNEAKQLNNGVSTNTSKKNNRSTGLKMASKSNRIKTGWIDDTLNVKNKKRAKFVPFITLIKIEFNLEVWPEFYFTTERQYRFDFAIPIAHNGRHCKIAIECDGGTHMRGNSGHSSAAGIARDMQKSSLAAVNGWTLIRVTPRQLCTEYTISLIRQALSLK